MSLGGFSGAIAALAAALLFWAELWVARRALPQYGGAPQVWNACMFFFQALLFVGYALAHVLARRRRGAAAGILAVLTLGALAVLPLAMDPIGFPGVAPALELVATLAIRVGLPCLLLAVTTPLLAAWSAGAPDRAGGLYAWSNAGSAIGLLAMPFVLEPLLGLGAQARTWSAAFAAFAALLVLRAAVATPAAGGKGAAGPTGEMGHPGQWFLLSMVPVLLLHGSTALATTDLAPMPLLWVGPLLLYLASFVIAFGGRAPGRVERATAALAPLLAAALVLTSLPNVPLPADVLVPALGLHLAGVFGLSLLLHRELARRKSAADPTAYFLWISAGGLAGGALCGLAAPWIFVDTLDYPLATLAAGAIAAHLHPSSRRAGWMALGLLAITPIVGWGPAALAGHAAAVALCALLLAGARAWLGVRWTTCAVAFGLACVLGGLSLGHLSGLVASERSFFGMCRVLFEDKPVRKGDTQPPPRYAVLLHGSTVHGRQSLDPARRGEPLTYFARSGPAGQAIERLVEPPEANVREVGVLGLGIGCLAAYARPPQRWTFYELDPVVLRLARDERFFGFLADAERRCPVAYVLGDARLELGRPGPAYDLLVFDTFSSDAVPMHLLTREAFAAYRARLAPDGVMLWNISHRHVDLRPLVAALAAEAGFSGIARREGTVTADEKRAGKSPSSWVVLAGTATRLAALAELPGWEPIARVPDIDAWTDDRASLLPLLLRGWR